ncbi:pentapeptide repeat-containing protein [Anabaena cylindrica UHCC 0172]|uniref:NACHT domain-containing protein n=1 Tax=Anabaena cylindrica TaxID=1165 RepID=UPI002B221887|nr:pentapeptide repeat-containing protein [Anabaena cylindrica]MEA5552694.1 pentapeptide repeat-containing protein [Anabaena cylindrica UHCC 0172]
MAIPNIKHIWQRVTDNGEKIELVTNITTAAAGLVIALGVVPTAIATASVTTVTMASIPLIGLGGKWLQSISNNSKSKLEEWVALAIPIAYISSFDNLVRKNYWLEKRFNNVASGVEIQQEITELGKLELDAELAKQALTGFLESHLGLILKRQLSIYLEKAGIDKLTAEIITGWVGWGTLECIEELISQEIKSKSSLSEILKQNLIAAQEKIKNTKYSKINFYLQDQISPESSNTVIKERWQILGEKDLTIPELYVPLQAELLDSNGKVIENANPKQSPVILEKWAKDLLINPDSQQQNQVMFIQGGPGRGKSVFCRVFAEWVNQNLHPIWTPILIRLRDINTFENDIKQTIRTSVNADFAQGDDSWLTDANTRFLFLLDGFDELRMQRSSTMGIEAFLKQIGDLQQSCHSNSQMGHRFLITGRESALQGIERFIPHNLARVEICLMKEDDQEEWLKKWGNKFGEDKSLAFGNFLKSNNCPEQINTLAQEPLLLYLLAAMHRDGEITDSMLAGVSSNQAKIIIYQKTVDWVLTKQRSQELNKEITALETEALKRILAEVGLCVTQTEGEYTLIKHIEERLRSDEDAKEILEDAQIKLGDNPLRNALAAFYLKPASANGVKEGAVEFVHKSFSEFLFAQRLQNSCKQWIAGEEKNQRWRFNVSKNQFDKEIYDLLGYGGLTGEIVQYLIGLILPDSGEQLTSEELLRLFTRLQDFYYDWCAGKFINAYRNNLIDEEYQENLPQNKMMQLHRYGKKIGLREVDIYTGLNVLILLFKLHNYARAKDELKDKISFHPGQQLDRFDENLLNRIISYSNIIKIGEFLIIVGQYLRSANLCRAYLGGAFLIDADFSGANLSRTNLSGANLWRTNLSGANLSGANLSRTYLNGTDLSGTNLSDANLSGAYLSGADLSDAKNLLPDQVKLATDWQKAIYDDDFRLQLGLTSVD